MQNLSYIDFVQKTIASYRGLTPECPCLPQATEGADMLLRATNSYAYVVDYRTGGYHYFSNTFKDIVNHPTHLLKKEGIRQYTSLIHKQDWAILNEPVFKAMHQFLAANTANPERKLRFIFNYRIQKPDGITLNIRQINNFLKLDGNGSPLLNAGLCTVIPYAIPSYKITYVAQSLNSYHIWENEDVKTFVPAQVHQQQLSPTELNILHWIKNGYSSEKIADRLNRSLHTIKTHRKNMLEKTQSKNTAELLQFSMMHGLV